MKRAAIKRSLKWLGTGLLALVLIVVVLISLTLNTEWGARFALGRVTGLMPGSLKVDKVEGTLAGPLTLGGIRYRHEGLRLDAERLALDPDLSALVSGAARIEEMSLDGTTVQLPPPGSEPAPEPESDQPFKLPKLDLPVAVAVEDLSVTDLRVVPHEGDALVIHSFKLGTALVDGELVVDRFALDTSLGYVNLAGAVDTLDAWQTDLELEFGARRKDALIEGRLTAQGDLDRMRVQTRVGTPVHLRLDATLENVPEELAFSARLQLAGLDATEFGVGALPGPVRADLTFDGGLEHVALQGTVGSGERDFTIDALEVGLSPERVILDRLNILGEGETRLSASGRLGLTARQPVVDFQAKWAALTVPMAPNQVLESSAGDITVKGTMEDYLVTANVRIGGAVPAGVWRLRGRGSLETFSLESLQAETLDGTIQASGQVRWTPRLEWQLDLSADRINPAALAPEWPGHLDVELQTEGLMSDDGPEGRLQLQQLNGTLRGRPVDTTADVRLDGFEDIEGELRLASGDSEITASGHYGTQTDVDATLSLTDLQDLYPEAGGTLQGDLHLTGTQGELRLQGDLQGSELAFADNRVEELSAAFDLAQAESVSSRLTLDAASIQAAGIAVNTLALDLDGTRAAHELSLALAGPQGDAALALEGGLHEQVWQGVINRLRLASQQAGTWQLREAAPLSAGAEAAGLERFCLASEQGEVCASGGWQQQQGLSADLTLSQLPLAAADAVLTQALKMPASLDGTLSGEAHADLGPNRTPAMTLQLQTSGVALTVEQAGTRHRLTLEPFHVDATLAERELDANLELVIEELGKIAANLSSPSFNMEQPAVSPFRASLTLDVRTLKPLAPLIAPLAKTDARIEGRMAMHGTLRDVNLSGDLSVTNFTTQVPAAGLELTDGRFTLHAGGRDLRFDGALASGGGQLTVDGNATLPADAPARLTVHIDGERFLAADMPGVQVFISPALEASVDGKRVEVTGAVEIPEATVNTGEIEGGGPGAVGASPDVVVVGQEKEKEAPPLELYAEVDVILGEDIELTAPGFEGGADGQLHVSVVPDEPALGSGEVMVTGTYQAYGQDLTIREGQLLYSDSPLANPGLAITAVRVVDDVTAGVRIGGTAKAPELTLFSEPPLGSEAEILSYVVLGKPLNQASGGEGIDMQEKATVKGAGLLAKQIGARFGLEDVSVEETETGASVLSIGKYLSPRLYLSYGMGILEPVTIVQLQYELSDIWTLEASSGTETRAGIQFEYEP